MQFFMCDDNNNQSDCQSDVVQCDIEIFLEELLLRSLEEDLERCCRKALLLSPPLEIRYIEERESIQNYALPSLRAVWG